MPIYTCTTAESMLTGDMKARLSNEISRIHSAIDHVSGTDVNVVFIELPFDCLHPDGAPACPLLITGWVHDGYPEQTTTRLAAEIASTATGITGIPAERVLVAFESHPAHYVATGTE
jgi:phenylpyruvate tautomerase PptA (4-oxalocrotonate tautomerase family)